jgi:hypothetical protein
VDERVTRTRLDPETAERFVPLRRRLGVSSFGVSQITLQPGERGRIHRQLRQEEVYLVLEGTTEAVAPQEPPLPANLPATELRDRQAAPSPRSRARRTLPLVVFGSSAANSTMRGYL